MTGAEEESADKGSLMKSRPAVELSPQKDKIFTLPDGVMDPTVSSGTISLTVPMTLQHFPYPPPTYYIGPQGAPPLSAYSPFLYMFCQPPIPSLGDSR